jgi:glycosyltransferase involved in cell wall biosynthesis
MKLIVQIPCYNEEKTLPLVLKSIPKKIKGIDEIEVLVINDGCRDKTVHIAKKHKVEHILHHKVNKGLARSFADGIQFALTQGADIIVNTDADNQYPQKDIPKLIQPIIDGKADIVIADRQIPKIKHFSWLKKRLQRVGTRAVRILAGSSIPDAASGFRAYSRQAALQLNIVTDFSYVIETIIQAEYKRLAITSIKVMVNPPTRSSRLFKNSFQHIRKSTTTMLRIYTMYRPLTVFTIVGASVGLIGIIAAGRFLIFLLLGQGSGHVQSILMGVALIVVGMQIFMTGVVADLIGINRRLTEEILKRMKLLGLTQAKNKKTNETTLDYVKQIKQLRKSNGNGRITQRRVD